METKVTTKIIAHLDDLCFGYWYIPEPEADGEIFPLEGQSETEIKDAAEYLGVSVRLIETLNMFSEDLRDQLGADLRDIWQRLDRVEKALKG